MAAAGDRIGKFTLVRQLGAGGMGETWEAVRQTGHDFEQRVAIKLAAPGTLESPDALASFRSEGTLAASLRHPNIAGVLDIDERSGYIVCELVDGADLRAVLRAAPGGKLDVAVLVHILAQIARGLSHAHRRVLRGKLSPVIHRDMSPGNVVVDYDGNVKIVDFGIAKAMASPDISESIKGKLSYMAPEQAMGVRMDGRVDQYALGVIAYEALTGVRPNDGAHEGETLAWILGGRHIPLGQRAPHLDPAFAAVIERMLALRPDQRFPTMEAVLDALVPFTPSFTIHRDLVPLVIHARQPHTILRENGQFVSRPVAILPSHDAHTSAPSTVAFGDAVLGFAPKATPRRPAGPAPVMGHGALSVRGRALAGPLHLMQALISTVSANASVPVEPETAVRPRPAPPVTRPIERRALIAAAAEQRRAPRASLGGVFASRAFWQGLTLLGGLLLALVAWVALSPDALSFLGPSARVRANVPPPAAVFVPPPSAAVTRAPAPSSPSDAPVADARGAGAEPPAAISGAARSDVGAPASDVRAAGSAQPAAVSGVAKVEPSAASSAVQPTLAATPVSSAPDHAALTKNGRTHATALKASASLRVKVFPWGRVWVDRQLRGEASPGIELTLTPGSHSIAVGRETALDSRSVVVKPGDNPPVSFDIEGK